MSVFPMVIRIKKMSGGSVLTCLREGQAAAVQRSSHGHFFALHDLLHYAVETELGLDEGFFGLMARGWSFDNFTRHDDPRYRPLPPVALAVEHLVGILFTRLGECAWDDVELIELLTEEIKRDFASATHTSSSVGFELSTTMLRAIHQAFNGLARQWKALPLGDHLELAFPAESTRSIPADARSSAPR